MKLKFPILLPSKMTVNQTGQIVDAKTQATLVDKTPEPQLKKKQKHTEKNKCRTIRTKSPKASKKGA